MALRDPSLHIRKSDLIDVLNEMSLGRHTGLKLANEIFERARGKQITDRYLQVIGTKKKTRDKAARSMQADSELPDKAVEKFNLLLTTHRQKMNKFGRIKPITKDSKDYLMLKEITALANDFVESFDIKPIEDGYKEFIEIGYGMMRKYALNRFKYYAPKISEIFADKVTVLMDEDVDGTRQMYEAWKNAMIDNTGLDQYVNIENDYSKYSCMVLAREDADAQGADYTDWVDAQFDGLAFLDAIPELSQFYGENAIKRYERFVNKSVEFEEDNNSITGMYD